MEGKSRGEVALQGGRGEELRRDGDLLGLLPNEAGCSPRGKLWALSQSGASVCAGMEGVVEVRTARTVRTNRSSAYHGCSPSSPGSPGGPGSPGSPGSPNQLADAACSCATPPVLAPSRRRDETDKTTSLVWCESHSLPLRSLTSKSSPITHVAPAPLVPKHLQPLHIIMSSAL